MAISLPRKFSFWKTCLFLSIPFCIVLGGAEIVFRLIGYEPLVIEAYIPYLSNAYFWINDQHLGFRNKPNGAHHFRMIKGAPLATTDEFGFRHGYGWTIKGNNPIVAFIGDSIIFCAEVNDDQTAPSEVAKLLFREFDVRVLNAGVRGYNTLQAKRMLEECLRRFPRIKLVVYVYCENDYYHNLNPLVYFPAQTPTVWWNETRDNLIEVEVSNPTVAWGERFWVPDYIRHQSARLRFTNFLRTQSVLLHQVGLRFRKLMGPKNPDIPNTEAHTSHTVADTLEKRNLPHGSVGPVGTRQEEEEQMKWAKEHGAEDALKELLRQMDQRCQEKGIRFVTTAFTRGTVTVTSHDEFARYAREAGVTFISIAEAFTKDPLAYSSVKSDGGYDAHYGPNGTQTFARALFPELKAILSKILVQYP